MLAQERGRGTGNPPAEAKQQHLHSNSSTCHRPGSIGLRALDGLSTCDTAIELLRQGFWPIANWPGSKVPLEWISPPIAKMPGPGEKALEENPPGEESPEEKALEGSSWGLKRPDEESIRYTFKRFPRAGVGILLGPKGGIIDIEIDGPEGGRSLARLLGGSLVPALDTLGSSSCRGAHHFFLWDERMARYKSVLRDKTIPGFPDLEIRFNGDGKQIQSTIPPTIGDDGRPRVWNEFWVIAEFPEVAYGILDGLKHATHRSTFEPGPTICYTPDPLDDGDTSLGTPYGLAALSNECDQIVKAEPGKSHNLMRDAAIRLKALELGGHLSEKWRDRFWFAARHRGKPDKEIKGALDYAEAKANHRGPCPSKPVKKIQGALASGMANGKPQGHYPDDWSAFEEEDEPHTHETHGLNTKTPETDIHGLNTKTLTHMVEGSKPPPPKEIPCVSVQPCVSEPQLCVSVLDEDTRLVIGKYVLFDAAKPWSEALWGLRRELDPVACKNTWSAKDWRAVVAYWSEASKGNGVNLPGPDSVWAEFKRKLKADPRKPYGSELALVEEMVPEVTVPSELQGTTYEPVFRVMNVLAKLAAERGGDTFYVPCRLVAEKANGMDHKTAHRHLGALCKYGFLSLVKSGTPGTKGKGEANVYRWHDPPIPGKATWNSSQETRRSTGKPTALRGQAG